jgi:hypothetical protein
MFSFELFQRVSGGRVREADVSWRGYELVLGLLERHIKLPSAQNTYHYGNDVLYAGLLYLDEQHLRANSLWTT